MTDTRLKAYPITSYKEFLQKFYPVQIIIWIFSSNRLKMYTQLNLRLFKGFAFNVAVEFDYINDLVEIPMEGITTEEILLEHCRRSTNFQLNGHFGSKFSATYNPRL